MKKISLLILLIFFVSVSNVKLQWSEQVSGVTAELTSVWCVDASNVWVCGYLGTVLKSSNAGSSWINLTGNGIPTTVSLINICGFPSGSTNAIVAGYTGSDTWVWKTSNGGANWTQVFAQTGGFIDAVWMTSSTNGFMMGDPVGSRWSLWKTTNGGTNWDSAGLYLPQAGTEGGYNNSMIYTPPYIWFGTNNTKIYFSSNNGNNWISQPTTGDLNIYAIWFHPLMISGTGLFGGTALHTTTNWGTNWTTITALGSGNFRGITSSPLITDNLFQPVWYLRSSNIIYYSSNFGANWIAEYTNPVVNVYRHISMAYPGRGIWAVGTLGKITYHTPLMDIKKTGSEIPEKFRLFQNYPNPFNPITKIKFDIPLNAVGQTFLSFTLKVFDITGKEISTLVNEQLNPGTYEVIFKAGNLSSGIYFYKFQAGKFTDTKKLILFK